ncbi:MAG: VanZ family protein [candidate division Zixibacteria bacterium]|nr:VanZ family protein [candidate division Zixibacteria bacterium]
MKSRKLKAFAIYHLPAILYATLIISLSSISNLHLPRFKHFEFDKVVHFIEYAIFAALVFRSFSHLSPRFRPRTVLLLSLFFMIVFAAGDESFQRLIPGRQPDTMDFISDVLGALIILLFLWWRKKGRPADAVANP